VDQLAEDGSDADLVSALAAMDDARLRSFSGPEVDLDPCQIFARAAETPDAVTVVDGAQPLTYAELVSSASAIAAGLASQGVVPGAVVGVALPRSADLVATVPRAA